MLRTQDAIDGINNVSDLIHLKTPEFIICVNSVDEHESFAYSSDSIDMFPEDILKCKCFEWDMIQGSHKTLYVEYDSWG